MNRKLRLIVCAGALASVALVHQVSQNFAETLYTVPGSANPWLAGQTATSILAITYNQSVFVDTAIFNSPVQANNVPLLPNEWLLFDVSGQTSNGPTHPMYNPDGLTDKPVGNFGGAMNGIANVNAPLSSLVGVFLSKNDPQNVPTPASLDFSTAQSRDFTDLHPELQQVFFIGDGLTSLGDFQHFYVPEGATRLYLAVMDGYEWNNNVGSLSVGVGRAIPTPAAASLLGLGGFATLSRRRRTA